MLDPELRFRLEKPLVVVATGLFAASLCFVAPTLLDSLDYVLMWKPNFQFLADAVREGRVPLWNPYIHLGRPYLADPNNATFYPPEYLICLGQRAGVFLLVWLHGLLAVFGMRRLAEALRVGRWQSYFIAFSFLASGAMTARWVTGQLTVCWAVCYLPWLFDCAIRTEAPWQARRVARYALLLAFQFICHPQVFWFSAIGQAVFIFTRALRLPLREAMRDAWRGLSQFGAACLWCAGLAAVVWLPTLELAKQSNRVATSSAFVGSMQLDWQHLGSLITPVGLSGTYAWVNWERNLFVGPVVFVFGLAGLCLVRERTVRGLLAVLVVALLMALGDHTPFFRLFYQCLPGFASFRIHARTALLVVLVLICTAGVWLSRPHAHLRTIWAENFDIPAPCVVVGLVLVQALLLLYATWVNKMTYTSLNLSQQPPDYPFQQTLVAQLRDAGLMKASRPPPRICVSWDLVPANYGMLYHYSNFDAYTPLFLWRPWKYLHAMLGIQPPEFKNHSLAQELYSRGPLPYLDLALEAGIDPATGILVVATNPSPRAFLVYAAEVAGDYSSILKRLANGHDIHRSALLEKPLVRPLPLASALPGTPASIHRFEPNDLRVEVDAKTNALLVLAEAWYPGWKAEINGKIEDSVPANLWMRAFPVPAGRNEVRVFFHQNYLLPGAAVTCLSAVGVLLAILLKRLRLS